MSINEPHSEVLGTHIPRTISEGRLGAIMGRMQELALTVAAHIIDTFKTVYIDEETVENELLRYMSDKQQDLLDDYHACTSMIEQEPRLPDEGSGQIHSKSAEEIVAMSIGFRTAFVCINNRLDIMQNTK